MGKSPGWTSFQTCHENCSVCIVQRWRFVASSLIVCACVKTWQMKRIHSRLKIKHSAAHVHLCTLEYCYWFTAITSSHAEVWDDDVADKQCHFHGKFVCHVQQLPQIHFFEARTFEMQSSQSNYFLYSTLFKYCAIVHILKVVYPTNVYT